MFVPITSRFTTIETFESKENVIEAAIELFTGIVERGIDDRSIELIGDFGVEIVDLEGTYDKQFYHLIRTIRSFSSATDGVNDDLAKFCIDQVQYVQFAIAQKEFSTNFYKPKIEAIRNGYPWFFKKLIEIENDLGSHKRAAFLDEAMKIKSRHIVQFILDELKRNSIEISSEFIDCALAHEDLSAVQLILQRGVTCDEDTTKKIAKLALKGVHATTYLRQREIGFAIKKLSKTRICRDD